MLKKFNLKNKNAVVTGGSGLLGKEHCIALLEVGCNVICIDIDKEALSICKNSLNSNFENYHIKNN